MALTGDVNWWRGGVLYQVYPRSFFDSNSDGIGDLPGISQKLEYIADLGVDGIWLSPFFTSPMKDFGYDVANYRDVDPMFGTLEDFDHLVEKAHGLGLRVTIDQVLSHSSDAHPWFRESRSSIDNPKSDWYVWADPKPDGTPPNNWLSIFGGSAWKFDTTRQQYYMHNFLASQPDLNFHNPDVQQQLLDDVEFWLRRGVDGFRLDTANFYVHDKQLRDNPPWIPGTHRPEGAPKENPYTRQMHVHDKTQPENLAFLKKLRAVLDKYPGSTTVGEIGSDNSLATMAEYTAGGDKLHMAYTINLLESPLEAGLVRGMLVDVFRELGDGWPCWAVSNHDFVRVASRWGKDKGGDNDARLRMIPALYTSLRGTPCIYQGEELGLEEAIVPYEQLQDPYGIEMWPEFKGRDGCRTPMPWHNANVAHGGFTTSDQPWLPVPQDHSALSVASQIDDPDSLRSFYKNLLTWRKNHPEIIQGDIEMLEHSEDAIIGFVRMTGIVRTICVFNVTPDAVTTTLPGPSAGNCSLNTGSVSGDRLSLPGWGFYFGTI
ncbi:MULTISPECIES: alpha-glucosidase [unclassified Thalassospira]|uniref:alpha-glucosidase n=1 Tax=unclassified Thalassospira TaxID=2648997 RepID=UPI000A1F21DD|nr:alpha-glucosidase [Thalassospira sp. MCCC 1A01428]OSQ44492.1 alpha-glucosidase [Thalassospira sp. MCCC 1A01428]